MITERQLPMSEHPPSLLIVYLRPNHEEEACYHIDEALTTASISYRLIAELDKRISLESATPFVITHIEKRMVFALHASLAPKVIDDQGFSQKARKAHVE